MAHIQFVDELVKEYLLFRGFTSTFKAFDTDIKADKEKGFRVDKIVEQIMHFINTSDLSGLKEYWLHIDKFILSKLEIQFQPAIRAMEYSIYKLYLVTAAQGSGGVKNEHVTDFLQRMAGELQGQAEWKDWFMLPFIQKPEENILFSLYFTRSWQDSILVSLHNLLATVFQCMPQPTLTGYESDAAYIRKIQDELVMLRVQTKTQATPQSQYEKTSSSPLSSESTRPDRLSGPQPLIDHFYALPAEDLDAGSREAKGLRGLIRQMGGSPVMGRRQGRSQSQI